MRGEWGMPTEAGNLNNHLPESQNVWLLTPENRQSIDLSYPVLNGRWIRANAQNIADTANVT